MSDQTDAEKLAEKINAAIAKAGAETPYDLVQCEVTLMGDGKVHNGLATDGRFEEGDTMVVTARVASNLGKRGLVAKFTAPPKPKAAKKAKAPTKRAKLPKGKAEGAEA